MDKTRVLLLPIGQGASIVANGLKRKNKRYPILFINSTPRDSVGLEFFKPDLNVVLYNGAKGTGNNSELGKELAEDNRFAINSKLASYNSIDIFNVMFTMGGGTGSGGFSTIVKLIKRSYPSKKVNLVGFAPRIDEGVDRIENFLKCWNEIDEVLELVDDVKIVDNSYKYDSENKSFDAVNKAAIEHIDAMYSLTSSSVGASIDENDSYKVCTAKGFGQVLLLPDLDIESKVAIDIALGNSPFALPEKNELKCQYAGINIKPEPYNHSDIAKNIKASTEPYTGLNGKQNIVVLGGGEMPTEFADILEEQYKEAKAEEKNRRSESRASHKIKLDLDDEDDSNKPRLKSNDLFIDDDEDDELLLDDSWM